MCEKEHGQIYGDVSRLPKIDLSETPSFLSIPIYDYLKEGYPVMRLHRMCDTAEIIARFLTVVGIAELRGEEGDLELPEDVEGWLSSSTIE